MSSYRLILALTTAILTSSLAATPISLGGILQDSQGNPLSISGIHTMRVVYYETEDSESPLATSETSVEIEHGIFSGYVEYPESLLPYNEVWYELAVDTNSDGIDENDFFNGRFRIAASPFALGGKAYSTFNTHGGAVGDDYNFLTNNKLHLSVFTTPPSSVPFNRIALRVHARGAISNVGIYDAKGDLLFETEPFIQIYGAASQAMAFPVEGVLNPSTQYFVGFTSTGPVGDEASVPDAVGGEWAYAGFRSNMITTTNGLLPTSFDPMTSGMSIPVNLALFQVDPDSRRSDLPQLPPELGVQIALPMGYQETIPEEELEALIEEARKIIRERLQEPGGEK